MSFVIFDVVILILLLLTAWKGYRRGFVLTLCSLLAVFVAFIGATVISSQLARPMSRLIQPALERSITQVLEEQTHACSPRLRPPRPLSPPPFRTPSAGKRARKARRTGLAQLPLDEVLDALQASSLYQHFIQPIQDAIQDGVMEVTTSAARAVADYLALELTRMFLFLVSFALVLLLWLLLSRVLDLACKLPVLSTLNHWSGRRPRAGEGGTDRVHPLLASEGLPDLPGGGGGDGAPPLFLHPHPSLPAGAPALSLSFSLCAQPFLANSRQVHISGLSCPLFQKISLSRKECLHRCSPPCAAAATSMWRWSLSPNWKAASPRMRDCASSAPRSWASSPSTT